MGSSEPDAEAEGAPRAAEVRNWFQAVVRDNYRALYAIAYGVLRNAHDAEEAVQESCLKAYRSLATLEDPARVVSWLAMVTRNTARDMIKKKAPTPVSPELLDGADGASEDRLGFDECAILLNEVSRLASGDAIVVTLYYLEELSVAEIAERVGISRGATKQRLLRSRGRLRDNPRLKRLFRPPSMVRSAASDR